MFPSGKWRLLRCIVFITFLVVGCFTVYTVPHLAAIPPKEVPGWELNVTRDVANYIHPGNDTTIISGKEICDSSTFLVIVVTSVPSNFKTRSAIRETWGSRNASHIKVGFIVGSTQNASVQTAIEEESAEFKDIIQDNFIDSYNNLTLKSIFLLKWFAQHCHSPEFLMKADDDTYIEVGTLTKRLAQYPRHNMLLGHLICKAKPVVDTRSKWYSPKYMYHSTYYPNYLSGSGYVMSRDVVSKLYEAALKTPIMYLEDVYITGICSQKAGIRPRNFGGFNYDRVGLECHPNVITNHHIKPDELRLLWNQRDNCSLVLSKPTRPPIKRRKFENICH